MATPESLAQEIVRTYSGLSTTSDTRVLEPSAGNGSLVKAVLGYAPQLRW